MRAIEVVMMSRVYLVEVSLVRGVGGDSREEGTTQEEFPNVMTAAAPRVRLESCLWLWRNLSIGLIRDGYPESRDRISSLAASGPFPPSRPQHLKGCSLS